MVYDETIDLLRNGFPYVLVLLLLVNPALGQSFKLDKMVKTKETSPTAIRLI